MLLFSQQRPVPILHGERRQVEELCPSQLVDESAFPEREQVQARSWTSLGPRGL
jgi:hypothetical protein